MTREGDFIRLFAAVNEILFFYDPAYLSEICPKDEYAVEAGAVLAKALRCEDEDTLALEIYRIFEQMFDTTHIAAVNDPLYRYAARDIRNRIKLG
jgi:hypothetical protein